MSLELLLQDIHKEWLNARVNNLTVDGILTTSGTGAIGTSTGLTATYSGAATGTIGGNVIGNIGNIVFLKMAPFPTIAEVNSDSLNTQAGFIPSGLLPANDLYQSGVFVVDGGTGCMGTFYLNSGDGSTSYYVNRSDVANGLIIPAPFGGSGDMSVGEFSTSWIL